MDIGQALGRPIPYATLLGIRLRSQGENRAEIELTLRPELMNSWDTAHGGVLMTLLDIAMAVAARNSDPRSLGAITVEMKANFIGTCRGTIVADGRCVHAGKSVAFCQAEARDEAGKLVATASGTFMVRRERGGQDDSWPRETPVER
jgi:uncharacterized protein (TIGR00369 family)